MCENNKELNIKAGQVYSANKPKQIGLFEPLYDDRQVIYVSPHKQLIKHIDHGYNQEYLNWCAGEWTRITGSTVTELEYENETGKQAKNIESIWDFNVQYDSPSLKFGKKYPIITLTKFLKWAGKNITNEMPNGEWRRYEKT